MAGELVGVGSVIGRGGITAHEGVEGVDVEAVAERNGEGGRSGSGVGGALTAVAAARRCRAVSARSRAATALPGASAASVVGGVRAGEGGLDGALSTACWAASSWSPPCTTCAFSDMFQHSVGGT